MNWTKHRHLHVVEGTVCIIALDVKSKNAHTLTRRIGARGEG